MDIEARETLHNEQTSHCRSFGSNIHLSSQTRKISIGVMADSNASTKYGAMKGDGAVMPNAERIISTNVGNFIGEKNQVEGVTAFNINQTGGPEAVKCSWVSKSFYQRTPISEAILQANQASCLLVSPGGQDNPNGIEREAGKHSVQLFSCQTSKFPSNNYKKFDVDAGKRKGRKGGTTEKVKEFRFTTAQEVFESDKTEPAVKIDRPENRTEHLRMKLCQILGTTTSPMSQHSGSHTRNMDEESLPFEQRLDQKDKSVMTRQNSDTIETDSENPDHNKRPVTRSWSRKKSSSKKQPGKGKNGPASKYTEKHAEKSIFSFEERWIGRQDAFPNDGSLKKKSRRKNSTDGQHICLTENDTTDKLHQDILKTDLPLQDGISFSLGKKMGGFIGRLSDYQTKCPQTEKINQEEEFHQLLIVNNIDQHGELEVSGNGNEQENRSNPVIQNVVTSQDNFQSPTLQLKTPILSFPSSTPKTDRQANDVSSPASTERIFSLETIRSLRIFQTLEPEFDGLREQRHSSDMEELKFSIPRKDKSSEMEEKERDDSSDASSEDWNFQGSNEGSGVRHTSKRKKFTLRPIKRLCRHDGIKFNHSSPASQSLKGTGDSDWIDEASEQNQDGAVELLALELGNLQNKLKSMTSQKSSEILKSVAEELNLQLQNVHSQIQTDMGKLTNLSKSKRKLLETRFEDQQKQLRLIFNRFKEEVNLHLQDCRSTVEDLEADQIEIKGVMERQRVAHKKLLLQVEEAVEIQLNDAQRKIRVTQEKARGKLLQLKHVVAMCLKEGILN